MISLEFESHMELTEKGKAVHKELELLKKAVEKKTKIKGVEEHIHLEIEMADLFIERKDRKRQSDDSTFDISPGDHLVFNLIHRND